MNEYKMNIIIVFLISIYTFLIVCISSSINQSIENDDDINKLFNKIINTTKDNDDNFIEEFQMNVFKRSIENDLIDDGDKRGKKDIINEDLITTGRRISPLDKVFDRNKAKINEEDLITRRRISPLDKESFDRKNNKAKIYERLGSKMDKYKSGHLYLQDTFQLQETAMPTEDPTKMPTFTPTYLPGSPTPFPTGTPTGTPTSLPSPKPTFYKIPLPGNYYY